MGGTQKCKGRNQRWPYSLLVALLAMAQLSCGRGERLKAPALASPITRRSDEVTLPAQHRLRHRAAYPWEGVYSGSHLKITKEHLRCRGARHAPLKEGVGEDGAKFALFDCGGPRSHSLPCREGKEEVYPILLELLNWVQDKSGKRVIVTCGHRCPAHNTYSDPTTFNQTSKHLIGAEVDFYVQGLERQPEEVVALLLRYYEATPWYSGKSAYQTFHRYEKEDTNVSIPPWYNKEVFIKLYQPNEGRDLDNTHPYPYLSIQVRYDRARECPVTYTWKEAFRGYRRG